jgi:hypothetical protein
MASTALTKAREMIAAKSKQISSLRAQRKAPPYKESGVLVAGGIGCGLVRAFGPETIMGIPAEVVVGGAAAAYGAGSKSPNVMLGGVSMTIPWIAAMTDDALSGEAA